VTGSTGTAEFALNRRLMLALTLACVAVTALGVGMLVFPGWKDPWAGRLIGAVVVVLCGPVAVALGARLIDQRPALAIDDRGLDVRSTVIPVGLEPWTDIMSVRVISDGRAQYLAVEVRNPDVYVERAPAFLRWVQRGNADIAGTPVTVAGNSVKANLTEVSAAVIARMEARS
jgi:hypothetical protein